MKLSLFEAYGVELEYMLVDSDGLDPRPMADSVLALLNQGSVLGDAECGAITWSNELALHVLECKSTEPAPDLVPLASQFTRAIADLQPVLERCNLRLLPTAMHPWMQPAEEVVLWPHEYYEVYAAYHALFNCKTHGWGNVQSVHLNLPFSNDEEFAKLHAAIRLVLPLLPALAASSPVYDLMHTGVADNRMVHYAGHCAAVPCMVGPLVPEPVANRQAYEREILQPIHEAFAGRDASGAMQPAFLNARGAIARFDRGSIEIRVMDVQEYPLADLAVCAATVAVLRGLVAETWSSYAEQFRMGTDPLRDILQRTTQQAEFAIIDVPEFLRHFGIQEPKLRAAEVWEHLLRQLRSHDPVVEQLSAPLELILRDGTLATRIGKALAVTPETRKKFSREELQRVYRRLAECLQHGHAFQA